ncbi:hypothetical protein VNO78_02389 [Psophocarpus tetragonolobus]|uniref:Uncharacterized protein n=1 Tax=Psophocarpus tetragonolobus TaxID=3891 RepID=A0AAN9SYN8_PSOTE
MRIQNKIGLWNQWFFTLLGRALALFWTFGVACCGGGWTFWVYLLMYSVLANAPIFIWWFSYILCVYFLNSKLMFLD